MERTALLSALAPRARPTIAGAPDGRTRTGWLAHESQTPAATCFRRSLAVHVIKRSSLVTLVAVRRARSSFEPLFVPRLTKPNEPNRAERRSRMAIGETAEPSRAESSRIDSNRTEPEPNERSARIASYLSWRLACASPHVTSACTVPHHTTLCSEHSFFPLLSRCLRVFDTPRSVPDLRLSRRSAIMPELFIRERR